jgi:hypothetical protein
MYASLPLMDPSRVICSLSMALATPKSSRRATPSTPTRMFCGDTSRWTISSALPASFRASCAAWSPWSTPMVMAMAMGNATSSLRLRAALTSEASDWPCTYSITRKSSPASEITSSVCTTFGWTSRDAIRASSMNIAQSSGCFANCGCRRLMATVREKPAGPFSRPA